MASPLFPRAVTTTRQLCSLVAGASLASLASLALPAPSQAAATNFRCGTSQGVPTTLAATDDGRTVPMIRWTSNTFESAGWTAERRCQEVSQRFETYRQQGRLTFITTGRMNGQPVICTAPREGATCDGLLYTLKPTQDPTLALRRLFDVRYKARGPLNETHGRLYVSLEDLLSGAASQESSSSQVFPSRISPVNTSSGTVKPLW